jgi:hypothetical protein
MSAMLPKRNTSRALFFSTWYSPPLSTLILGPWKLYTNSISTSLAARLHSLHRACKWRSRLHSQSRNQRRRLLGQSGRRHQHQHDPNGPSRSLRCGNPNVDQAANSWSLTLLAHLSLRRRCIHLDISPNLHVWGTKPIHFLPFRRHVDPLPPQFHLDPSPPKRSHSRRTDGTYVPCHWFGDGGPRRMDFGGDLRSRRSSHLQHVKFDVGNDIYAQF